MPDAINGLNICPISPLGFVECSTDDYALRGTILVAQTYDFTAAITEPYWALGFSSLGNSYPNLTNIEQAFYYNNLQVYPSDLPILNSTTVQFSDEYQTPTGLVKTRWQISFDPTNKLITIGNLLTKLPQDNAFRSCTEILLAFWKCNAFSFAVPPATILLPYE